MANGLFQVFVFFLLVSFYIRSKTANCRLDFFYLCANLYKCSLSIGLLESVFVESIMTVCDQVTFRPKCQVSYSRIQR